jgi:hypothetical protein
MTWFPAASGSGAAFVYNDGFTNRAHGIYEVQVTEEGFVSDPRRLYGYGDEYPVSSATVVIDDQRYGIATLQFPDDEHDHLVMKLFAFPRDPHQDDPPAHLLVEETYLYLGGTEPAYIGAVAEGGAIDVAFTRPKANVVEFAHIESDKTDNWQATHESTQALPPNVLPLSGDCEMWRSPNGQLAVRVGFEKQAVARVDDTYELGAFQSFSKTPLYGADDKVLVLDLGKSIKSTDAVEAGFGWASYAGALLGQVKSGFAMQTAFEPHTAVPATIDGRAGALVVPVASDPKMRDMAVGFFDPARGPTPEIVGHLERQGTDELYSSRAFVRGDKVYIAWTSFRASLMDLWIAVVDLKTTSSSHARRVATFGANR